MKFFTIKTQDPNTIGEYFRDQFFKQEINGKYFKGCYSTFELQDSVVKLPDEIVDKDYPEDSEVYTCAQKIIDNQKIVMKYYWDGDGILEFHFEDGSYLENDDCKKDYIWKWRKEGDFRY